MVFSPVNQWTFPVNPNFPWVPDIRFITSITNANPAVITTSVPHGYSTGFNVRIVFPFTSGNAFGMFQINGQTGVINVLTTTTFALSIDSSRYNTFTRGSSSITAISKASPCVVTVSSNNFAIGQVVTISGVSGMTQINGGTYTVSAISGNNVSLALNSSGFTAYVSGGTMQTVEVPQVVPIGQYTNADLDDSTQVNPVNPSTLAQVPLFQSPGLQAPGPCSTSQT